MTTLTTLPKKLPTEKVFVDCDFTNIVKAGVTIVSAVCTVALVSGTDASPASMISGSTTLDGTALIASQLYQSGLPDCVYLLICTATMSNGSIEVIELKLPVVSIRLG